MSSEEKSKKWILALKKDCRHYRRELGKQPMPSGAYEEISRHANVCSGCRRFLSKNGHLSPRSTKSSKESWHNVLRPTKSSHLSVRCLASA